MVATSIYGPKHHFVLLVVSLLVYCFHFSFAFVVFAKKHIYTSEKDIFHTHIGLALYTRCVTETYVKEGATIQILIRGFKFCSNTVLAFFVPKQRNNKIIGTNTTR